MISSRKAFVHVGSLNWIVSEKKDSKSKEVSCLEDFALSARNDFEWLNEYMFETFSRHDFIDVIEFLKTPGRLRGKTSRRIQKSKDKRHSSPFEEHPTLISPTITRPKDNDGASELQITASGELQDSGIWTTSDSYNYDAGLSPTYILLDRMKQDPGTTDSSAYDICNVNQANALSELLKDEARTAQASPANRVLDISSNTTSQPTEKTSGEGEPICSSETPSVSPIRPLEVTTISHHQSTDCSSIRENISCVSSYNSSFPSSSPYKQSVDEAYKTQNEETPKLPQIQQDVFVEMSGFPENVCEDSAQRSDKSSEPESHSPSSMPPQILTIVRSSINFASLPSRETLNNRKSPGSNRASRSSHLGNMPLTTNGFDGGRPSDVSIADDDKGQSDHLGDPDVSSQLILGEDKNKLSSYLTEGAVPTEKSKSQRLNERISQLSQLAPVRPSRSVPDTEAVTLNTTAATASKRPSELYDILITGQKIESAIITMPIGFQSNAEDEDEDWIPQRSQTAHSKSVTPECVPQDFIAVSRMTSASGTTVEEATEIPHTEVRRHEAVVVGISPSKLPKVTRVHNTSDTQRLLDRSTSKLTVQANRGKGMSPYKSPFDSALSAVKNHQANLFTKAKQMLFSKNKNEVITSQVSNSTITAQDSSVNLIIQTILPEDYAAEKTSRSINQQTGVEPAKHKCTNQCTVQSSPIINSLHKNYIAQDLQFVNGYTAQEDASADIKIYPDMIDQHDLFPIQQKSLNQANQFLSMPTADVIYDKNVHQNTLDSSPDMKPNAQNTDVLKVPKAPSTNQHRDIAAPQTKMVLQENIIEPSQIILEDNHSDSDIDGDRQQPSKLPKPTPNSSNRFQQSVARSSVLQKSTSNKNIIRSNSGKSNDNRNVKNPSTNIRLGTASQREMDQRKVPPSSAIASAPLISSNDASIQKESAIITKMNNPITVQNVKAPKSIAALTTAARAQKKEQEERERKKLEIERRRQENLKREEERKQQQHVRQKQTLQSALDEDQKKRARPVEIPRNTNSNIKPLVRVNTVSNLKKALEQASNHDNQSQTDLKRQPKRLFQAEINERVEISQFKVPLTGSSSTANGKRRKTEDLQDGLEEDLLIDPIDMTAVVASQANKNKTDVVKSGLFSQMTTPAPKFAQQGSKLKLSYSNKTTVQSQILDKANTTSSQMPPVDVVKFSHDTIKFAATTPALTNNLFSAHTQPSPNYPNGDSIELPDIQTDSEDDSDQTDFKIPIWAESPELRMALKNQLVMDPESVFGPMAPLSMEDIFKGRGDRVNARFRNRTSSANWGGQDRLTSAEIEADKIERLRMIENNGWTYE